MIGFVHRGAQPRCAAKAGVEGVLCDDAEALAGLAADERLTQ
jgi:hypothetical protein